MPDQRIELFQDLRESILSTPGATSADLRATLTQYSANLSNAAPLHEISIPQELEAYVKKVALHAYRVTDQDIEALQAKGYSEDAIFEITLSVAFGASENCFVQAMNALKGVKDALAED